MSNMEKALGIIGVLVVCFIFLIVIIFVSLFIGRWKAKGVNPNKNFPRNPIKHSLTENQQRAINVGAILSASNSDFCDSLQTSKPKAIKTIKEILSRDWGIQSSKEAIEMLDELKYGKHHQIFNYILKNASRVLPYKEGTVDPLGLYEQIGFSLLDERILNDYAKEVALAKKNIHLMNDILNASSYEDAKKYQSLFGDEETFLVCIKIFHLFYKQFLSYENGIKNLDLTLSDLQKEGFFGSDLSELKNINTISWDIGRMVNVARYSYDAGYITENEAWEYLFFASKTCQLNYSDWAEFGKSYIVGRALWVGNTISFYLMLNMLKELKEDTNSPWKLVSLH
ncbi:MAG: DUF1266 domain-containing protein [Beduini sp.]|uniref:DUF1266 domain-containing protein n=1 Tax=Beduini sp. TaxID=1922300 RepID=UPI0011C93199